jgi:hypothetical protein
VLIGEAVSPTVLISEGKMRPLRAPDLSCNTHNLSISSVRQGNRSMPTRNDSTFPNKSSSSSKRSSYPSSIGPIDIIGVLVVWAAGALLEDARASSTGEAGITSLVGIGGTGGAFVFTLKTLGKALEDVVGLWVGAGLMVLKLLSSASGVPFSGVGDLLPICTIAPFFVGVLCLEKILGTEGAGSLTFSSEDLSLIGTAFSRNCNFVNVMSSSKSSSQLSVASSSSGTIIGLATAGVGFAKGKRFGMNGNPEAMPALELLERVGGDESFQVITELISPLVGAGVGEGERTLAGFEDGGGFDGDFKASFHCCTR